MVLLSGDRKLRRAYDPVAGGPRDLSDPSLKGEAYFFTPVERAIRRRWGLHGAQEAA